MGESAVFLQTRLASSRLPGKALLPLAGRTVTEHALEALRAVQADQYWIVTDEQSVASFRGPASRYGYSLFGGDAENVLKRFCNAAEQAGVETVVRATGDNPLVSADLANRALELYRETGADYAGLTGSPVGTGVEVLRVSALVNLLGWTRDPYHEEHVSPGLYSTRDRYRVVTRTVPENCYAPDLQVTIDTNDDYRRIARIFRELYRGSPIDTPRLLSYLRSHVCTSA
jgi:spore coat polysaccharide biosynthesis protein SpsF